MHQTSISQIWKELDSAGFTFSNLTGTRVRCGRKLPHLGS